MKPEEMIYLDYAATTPIHSEILEAYTSLLHRYYANSASLHALGGIADSLQFRAREQIAQLMQVDKEEIIFTGGASEGNNFAIKGVAFAYKNRGCHIITSMIEHPSVLNTCRQLEQEFGFRVTYLPVLEDGTVSLDALKLALCNETILVSIMGVNNETGAIQPIDEIVKIVKGYSTQIFLHCDATQAIGKIVQDYSDYDFVTMSAHKIYGLKGSGFIIKRKRVHPLSLINGGGQEFALRAGTSNWPVNVILAKTLRMALEQQSVHYKAVQILWNRLYDAVSSRREFIINSTPKGSPYIFNFSVRNNKASVIVQALEQGGICVSTVSACSSKMEKASHVIGAMFHDESRASQSIRISLAPFTTETEINRFLEVVDQVILQIKTRK